jgi:hypothetical protein
MFENRASNGEGSSSNEGSNGMKRYNIIIPV